VSPEQAAGLAAYLDVLRKWNQKSNLTAFELTPPSEAAIDRLIVEPVVAANRLLPADRLLRHRVRRRLAGDSSAPHGDSAAGCARRSED